MKPLRIILVMLEPPLPFGNAAARWFYVLLNGLVRRGHKVTAFAACGKQSEIEESKKLFPTAQYDLRCYAYPENAGILSKWNTLIEPFSYTFSASMRTDLTNELQRGFDILHLEQMWTGWLGYRYRDRALLNIHHLTAVDLEEAPGNSLRQDILRKVMFSTERRLVRKFRHIRSCSPRLIPILQKWNPTVEATFVPVGIDFSKYHFVPDSQRSKIPILTVIGSMQWYPTHSAAERLLNHLWPEIKKRVPSAKVQIVGWSARSVLKNFLNLPDITIEENVPDARPYFERASVMLYAPERGSGMKIKILEALAYGVPVVTTSEGVEGLLQARDGVHAGICDHNSGLIDRTVQLLNSIELQNRQREAGRRLLEEVCGPEPTLDQIENIYQKIVSGQRELEVNL